MTKEEILSTYLIGTSRADCYRRGFRCGIHAAMNWGFSTGDVSGQLMEHLDSLTKPLHPPAEPHPERDAD